MNPFGTLVLVLYFFTLGALSLFGLHRLWLLWLLHRHRDSSRRAAAVQDQSPDPNVWPLVTVQLPIYNEPIVAPRLIEAVAGMDYPMDRLEIQVLDDSTDETTPIVAALVARLRLSGLAIHHLQRRERRGFKGGALREGLAAARGDLIVIFDADFVPPPGFLRETVPSFADPRVGMVQARWGHLNAGRSVLTRVQALLLDGHFLVEQQARHLSGRFFNFNGTAGLWRRRCIEAAGGWCDDTLTEDLDLSYRAQLAGWRFVFLPRTIAPAELPGGIAAFKGQQHRWAKGSIQTARKLLPRVLRSPLPWRVRLEAFCHLTANAGHLLMVLLALLFFPAMLLRSRQASAPFIALDLGILALSTVAYWIFFIAAEAEQEGSGGSLRRAILTMPALMAVGVGISLNNALAVIEGLGRSVGSFERTPKSGSTDRLGEEEPAAATARSSSHRMFGKQRAGADASEKSMSGLAVNFHEPESIAEDHSSEARAIAENAGRNDRPHLSTRKPWRISGLPWFEGIIAAYLTLCLVLTILRRDWWLLPFLVLFWSGFTWITLASLLEPAASPESAQRGGGAG